MLLGEGGHYSEKGYFYRIYLYFPVIFFNKKMKIIPYGTSTSSGLEFKTVFLLINSKESVIVDIRVLGFGIGFTLHINNNLPENL